MRSILPVILTIAAAIGGSLLSLLYIEMGLDGLTLIILIVGTFALLIAIITPIWNYVEKKDHDEFVKQAMENKRKTGKYFPELEDDERNIDEWLADLPDDHWLKKWDKKWTAYGKRILEEHKKQSLNEKEDNKDDDDRKN